MNLTVFIIDDETPVRRELRYLLGKIEGVTVVGEAGSGTAALKDIRETQPDLVFLDIQMPGVSGLELSYLFGNLPKRPLLVFVTAYEEHAVKAFEAEALDYVLKPFTLERLEKSVVRARRFKRLADSQAAGAAAAEAGSQAAGSAGAMAQAEGPGGATAASADVAGAERRVPLYDGERIIPTLPKHILFVTSDEGRIVVHAVHGRYGTKSTLADLEARLMPHGFFRAHRSHLVNLNHVAEVLPWTNGSFKLTMSDRERTEILVSRYNAKELKAFFDL